MDTLVDYQKSHRLSKRKISLAVLLIQLRTTAQHCAQCFTCTQMMSHDACHTTHVTHDACHLRALKVLTCVRTKFSFNKLMLCVFRYYSLVENAIGVHMVAPLSEEWKRNTHNFVPQKLRESFKETLRQLDKVFQTHQ